MFWIISCLAARINPVIIEKRKYVRPISESAGGFVALQLLGRAIFFVAPTALEHELVPDQHLLFAWTGSVSKAPGMLERQRLG